MTEETQTPTPGPTPTPSPTPEPPAGGAPPAKFWEGFADEGLKVHPSVTKFETPEQLANALVMAEKRLGVPADQLLRLPTKPDDKDAYAEIYKKLGAPDTVEGYGEVLKVPEGATDEVKGILGSLGKTALEAHLSPTQLGAMTKLFNDVSTQAAEAEAARLETQARECQETLAREWGAKLPTYKAEIGKLMLDTVGKEGVEALNAAGFGDNLTLMRLFGKFADMRAEDGGKQGEGGRGDPDRGMTPGQAKAARIALEADPAKGKALREKNDPQHAAILEERNRLLALENPKAA